MLSLSLALQLILLLSNAIVLDATVAEAMIEPFSSDALPEHSHDLSAETASWFRDSFLEAYEETVDIIAGLQSTNWNYIPRYKSVDESKIDGMCYDINTEYISTSIPKFLRDKSKSTIGRKRTEKNEGESSSVGSATLPNGFQHDSDADIDRYLTELAEGCSKDIDDSQIGANRYQKECLDVLRNTIYEPRCTTRYDSRVECNGETGSREKYTVLPPPRELIEEHFGKESLNIVIIGAGPIGLFLANVLSTISILHEEEDMTPIRTLIVESRADAPGMKKHYSRNWQAQLNLLHFRNTVDPRLVRIFASMTDDRENWRESNRNFVLPLNAIETLLMLSNRDIGATKFLYGINQLELVDDLKHVPNLILVDATGHRLEPLRRGIVCDGVGEDINEDCDVHRDNEPKKITYNYLTPPIPEIPWVEEYIYDEFYEELSTFHMDFTPQHEFLSERGHSLHVAQTGDIMYPIDEDTKAPKTIYWIDIHGATLSRNQASMKIDYSNENLYAKGGAFCNWCDEWYHEQIKNGHGVVENGKYHFDFGDDENLLEIERECEVMCYPQFFASSLNFLREDIQISIMENRFNDTFVDQTDGWFPLMGYSFNPSIELANQVQKVLDDHGYTNHPIGMPLCDLYPALEGRMDTTLLSDADLDVVKALKQISTHSNSTKWPTVTQLTQHPFIYTKGLKKRNKCNNHSSSLGDHLENVPMIRIGDSFTTGDGLGKLILLFVLFDNMLSI